VRELRNAVERALILCEGGLINPEHLPWHEEAARSAPSPPPPARAPAEPIFADFPANGVDLEAMERSFIERALKQAGQNKSKAAKLLGLSRSKLYSRMQRFGLRMDDAEI
jgi:two-component system NtrC family response regulator